MTYKQVLRKFQEFAQEHKQVETWGYGSISDIEVPINPSTGVAAPRNYPYMFVNPTTHTLGNSSVTWRFNIIVMELTSDTTPTGFSGLDSVITAQSDALQIIEDFIAWCQYDTQFGGDVLRTVQIVPFKERFQDTVAGMTATIDIVLRKPANLCDAPL